MEKIEIARAGHAFMQVVDAVRDRKGRGFTDDEIKRIMPETEAGIIDLASKFLHEIKIARLGKALVLAALLGTQAACVPAIKDWWPAQGWEITLGVTPVTGLHDEKTLIQQGYQKTPEQKRY
jgi:hypothetical protein